MLEIGVSGGGSLAMWKDYLGLEAKILGIDIVPACKEHEAENIEVFIGSQDDQVLIGQVLEKYPRLDVVLDDGSHQTSHMIRSFELLYDHLAPHGVYIVEDTHTCYWPKYEGGGLTWISQTRTYQGGEPGRHLHFSGTQDLVCW